MDIGQQTPSEGRVGVLREQLSTHSELVEKQTYKTPILSYYRSKRGERVYGRFIEEGTRHTESIRGDYELAGGEGQGKGRGVRPWEAGELRGSAQSPTEFGGKTEKEVTPTKQKPTLISNF